MYVKSLEMSGFKSFADRTTINFEDGITGVVGPNGCGKSNIVDAIRWVMGEMSAKHLRGSAMEDVIFNGCESRPAVGMSQVFLTFDNTDGRAPAEYSQYSEIQIGRRLYRSGESEYFINKTPCRLKDVVDFFLGTGVGTKAYSIVEQGMVGSIVSSKPEDRRLLIEEAAGISKFKSRKEAALRKMESTRANLARLADIVAELTRQMNSLNRQAKKAERFKVISEELREKELRVAATRYRALRKEMDELSAKFASLKEAEVSSAAGLSNCEMEMERFRIELSELERDLEKVSEEHFRATNTIKLCEAEIGHKTRETTTLAEQNSQYASELSLFKERLSELEKRIDDGNVAMVSADLSLASSEQSASEFEAAANETRAAYDSIQSESELLAKRVMELGKELANLTSAQSHLDRNSIDLKGRIAKNQSELDGIDLQRKKYETDLSSKAKEVGDLKQLKLSITGESEAASSTLEQQKAILAEMDAKLQKLKDEISEKSSRLSTILELRKNLEGYRDGVRAVLARTDNDGAKLNGVLGTVGEIFETESEYEPALGAALGEKLQYVVVKSHEEGVDAIDYLRTASCGRGTFVPVGVKVSEEMSAHPEGEGVVGPLEKFVKFDNEYKNISRYLLGDVVLVEDLNRALNLWENSSLTHTFVTKDGCVVDRSGVVTGGSGGSVEEQIVAQKRRTRELEEELSRLKSELVLVDGEASKVRDRVNSMEDKLKQLGRDSHSEELRLIGEERDLARLRDELSRYERERDKLSVETLALVEELTEVEREYGENADRINAVKNEQSEAEVFLSEKKVVLDRMNEELRTKERNLTEFKVELAKTKERALLAERELENLIRDKTDAVLGIGRRLSDINLSNQRRLVLNREVEDAKYYLDAGIRRSAELTEKQRKLKDDYQNKSSAVSEHELKMRELRKSHDEALSAYHEVDIRLTEHKGKVDYLVRGIAERYRLDLPSCEGQYASEDIDLTSSEQEVEELKEKMEKIGAVNVDAIEEYREISDRYDFMSKQQIDLTNSMENLSKAIAKINRTSRQRFKRAFEAVDAQFQDLFPKLFRGGQARLMLTDEENILESGVEIIAQPPGKKLQSITLLSGGEKALTAVALIFSIFLTKPSPFCLLDEVDAPLDDANIDRFNDLIRSMIEHSQFILITHNKRTMEMADVLYGVTMEEAGVSKIVSVRLGQDKKKLEESAVA